MEPSVDVLDKIYRKEVEEFQRAEQERIRAEEEKKSDLELFNEMLYTDDQMYRVAQNLQPHMKSDIDEQIAAWIETSPEISSAITYVNKLKDRGLADSEDSDDDIENSVTNSDNGSISHSEADEKLNVKRKGKHAENGPEARKVTEASINEQEINEEAKNEVRDLDSQRIDSQMVKSQLSSNNLVTKTRKANTRQDLRSRDIS